MEQKPEKGVISKLFGCDIKVLPNVNEIFELELAFLEYNNLSKEQLLERTAYIKSMNGDDSRHYLFCSNIPASIGEKRSSSAKAYFSEGLFSTGYATHGLFPYRGKFHPQLIKALLNILNIQRDEIVLDPMAGSGTTNIEAALMGIQSIGIDINPFCQLMMKIKYDALTINNDALLQIEIDGKINPDVLFDYFSQKNILGKIKKIDDIEQKKVYYLAFLAYMDALGYSKRVVRSNHKQLFDKVLLRYVETVKALINNPYFDQIEIGKFEVLPHSNAFKTNLADESIDCIITSPPYSFAIDYVENDKDQLEYLGIDTNELKKSMIGLRGGNKEDKIKNYFNDMDNVCAELSRTLKKNKYCVIIIGSNTNQTGGIRLENSIITFSKKYNMVLERMILKPIHGMRNTMKDEYILIFRKIK